MSGPRTVQQVGALAAALVVVSLLSGCVPPTATTGGGSLSATRTVVSHVHAIDVDDVRERVTIATHDGLIEIDISAGFEGSAAATVLGEYRGDVMGFVRADDRFLVSGHPPAGADAPANVGVLAVGLDAKSWEPLALSGEVDFHAMSRDASGSNSLIAGLDSVSGAVLSSDDGGISWASGVAIAARDIAVVPGGGALVVTTELGLQISTDRGTTWSPIEGAPVLVLLGAGATTNGESAVLGVGVDGALHRSADGREWAAPTDLPFFPEALGVSERGVIVIANTERVLMSIDGGSTWSQIADLTRALVVPGS
mgnify:CR=1 FL=1